MTTAIEKKKSMKAIVQKFKHARNEAKINGKKLKLGRLEFEKARKHTCARFRYRCCDSGYDSWEA